MPGILLRIAALLLYLAFGLSACATHSELRQSMVDRVRTGSYTAAYGKLQDLEKKPRKKDEVMDLMDRAMILNLLGRYQESNQSLERIKDKFEELFGIDWADELAAIAWNDTARAFEGEEFEKVMVNMIAAFNYLHLGDLEGAGVEARQINHHLQVYVDRLKKNKVNTSYVQDPFAQYLAGLIQEASGDENDAYRSYEDALLGYEKIGPIMEVAAPLGLKAGVLRQARQLGFSEAIELYEPRFGELKRSDPSFWEGKARLVHIASLGEVAHKISKKWIIPDPQLDTIVVVYPEFSRGRFHTRNAKVEVDGRTRRGMRVHDLSTLAIKMMEEKNDQVKARAIAKTILMYAAKKITKNVAIFGKNTATQVTSMVANIALNVVDMVQEADTRTWMTLPDHLSLVEMSVEPGIHQVTVTYEGPGMQDRQVFDLKFVPGETRFLITRGREPGGMSDPPARPVRREGEDGKTEGKGGSLLASLNGLFQNVFSDERSAL